MGLVPNVADVAFQDLARLDTVDLDIFQASLYAPTGVQGISGCAVTAQGTPDMTVAVAAGVVRIKGRRVTVVAGNVTISAAHATNPRRDLITVDGAGIKAAVAGIPAATLPGLPSIPAGRVVLGEVYVPAAATVINTNQINGDKRVYVDRPDSENPRWYGALGNDSANDTQAILDAEAAAGAEAAASGGKGTVLFPDGIYRSDPHGVHYLVSYQSVNRYGATIKNRGTGGGYFLHFPGSGTGCRGMVVDGQRRAQVSPAASGASVMFFKPSGMTGGSQDVAGGLLLTATASAGATSITVSTSLMGTVPVVAWDAISFYDGTNYEIARVSPTYTGGNTITLVSALKYTWATTSYVTVFGTDNYVEDSVIRAVWFEGIELWHCHGFSVTRNHIYDATDTGIGVSAGGTRHGTIDHNWIEGDTKWLIFIDTGPDPAVGSTSGKLWIHHNTLRFLPKFADNPTGDQFECIGYSGAGGGASITEHILVERNDCDITLAGVAGIRLQHTSARHSSIVGNRVWCANRADTYGVIYYGKPTPPSDTEIWPVIKDNEIYEPGVVSFYLGDIITCVLEGNKSYTADASRVHLSIVSNNTYQQAIYSLNNQYYGGYVGISSGGVAPTLSPLLVSRGDLFVGIGFADFSMQAGWRIDSDVKGVVTRPEGATPAAPIANHAIWFARDDGFGKTQWAAMFPNGIAIPVATEGEDISPYTHYSQVDFHDEFDTGTITSGDIGRWGWLLQSAPDVVTLLGPEVSHPGILRLGITGTNDFGGISPRGSINYIATDVELYQSIVRVPTITTMRNRVGLVGDATLELSTTHVIFEYDSGVLANWRAKVNNGGAGATADTGVAVVAGNWYFLETRRLVNGNWEFWINGVLRATISTFQPTTGVQPYFGLTSLTTGTREGDIDFFRLRSKVLGQRWT